MAHIGMKYPVAAKWTEGTTYEEGFVVAKAINFTGTPNKNDVELYADDGVAETDKSVKDMGTSLGIDDLSLEIRQNCLDIHMLKQWLEIPVKRVLQRALRLEQKTKHHSLVLASISAERKWSYQFYSNLAIQSPA